MSLLARVLPLETLEQRLLEGGCNKSGYCMPRQIEDTLGPHALRVYAELRNLLGPNPRRDSPSQWLWHYEFCFGGADLTKSLEAKLEVGEAGRVSHAKGALVCFTAAPSLPDGTMVFVPLHAHRFFVCAGEGSS